VALDEATHREKIDRRKRLISRRQELLNSGEVPSERIPRAYGGFGNDARSIARHHLLLKEQESEAATDWFKQAAEYYIRKVREARERRHLIEKSYEENEPLVVRNALESALLSRDPDCLHEAANVAVEIDDSYPGTYPETAPWYYYVMALAALIRDEDDETGEYVERLYDDLDVFSGNLFLEYEGLLMLLTGLVDRDPKAIKTGFAAIFEHHERTIGNASPIDKLVCWPAMALRELVQYLGIDIEMESEHLIDF
jgi:hypothetical protein